MTFELESASICGEGHGALRNPSEGFCETIVDTIEESSPKAEGIRDGLIFFKLSLNAIMPVEDSRMQTEPTGMKTLCFANQPSPLYCCSSRRTTVVDSVDGMFAFLSLRRFGVTMRIEAGKLHAPYCFGVVRVDVAARAERGFEIVIFCLPCYDLGVCAL